MAAACLRTVGHGRRGLFIISCKLVLALRVMVALLLLILWPVAELSRRDQRSPRSSACWRRSWRWRSPGRSASGCCAPRDARVGAGSGPRSPPARPPGNEVVHGGLWASAGGALLIVPGFISDLVGLVLAGVSPSPRAWCAPGYGTQPAQPRVRPLWRRPETLRRRLDRDRGREHAAASMTGTPPSHVRVLAFGDLAGHGLGHGDRCRGQRRSCSALPTASALEPSRLERRSGRLDRQR